jgi:hypothetical protein
MKLTQPIILEGPDGSGKSHLFKTMTEVWGLPSSGHDGAAPKSKKEALQRLDETMRQGPKVRDRIPAISDIVYSQALGREMFLPRATYEMWLKDSNPFVIYCRPPTEVILRQDIKVKPYKSAEFCEMIHKARPRIIKTYDEVVSDIRRVCTVWSYDWTNSKDLSGLLYFLRKTGAVCAD